MANQQRPHVHVQNSGTFSRGVTAAAENAYMRLLRDVIQPVLVAFIGTIGTWFMLDHIALRSDVFVMDAQMVAFEVLMTRDNGRLDNLEALSLTNASNRFTDEDGDQLERILSRQIEQVDQRLTRVEDRINGQ